MPGLPRVVECALAASGLCVAAPLLVAASAAVKLTSKGPVFFRQQRVGKDGQPFTLVKMRTMRVDNAGAKVTAAHDPRITKVGRVLRKTKLDELPELWNVLRGDMSFVGPRPEVPRFVQMDDPLWQRALKARPGITDPVTLRLRNEEELLHQAEQAGHNRETFYESTLLRWKLRGYGEYLDRRSALSDVAVLLRTAVVVAVPSLTTAPTFEEIAKA